MDVYNILTHFEFSGIAARHCVVIFYKFGWFLRVLMDSVKLNFWEKCTEYNQTVFTFQVFEGADIRILLQLDDVTRFEVDINDKG